MYQQTHLSINFQEIFSPPLEAPEEPSPPLNQTEAVPPNLYTSISDANLSAPQPLPKVNQFSETALTGVTTDPRVRPFKLAPFIKADSSSNFSILSRSPCIKRKESTLHAVSQITQRLYTSNRTEREPSIKKQKAKEQNKSVVSARNQTVKTKIKNKSHNKSANPSEHNSTNNQPDIFEKMYNYSKFDHLKEKYSIKSSLKRDVSARKEHKWSKSRDTQSEYLKSYVPFYDRLDQEVNRSVEKIKLFEEHIPFCPIDGRTPFQPTLRSSRYSQVQSRYLQQPTKHSSVSKKQDNLKKSTLSSSKIQNKFSKAFIQKIEEHFFKRMTVIFIDEHEEIVQINEKVIQLLTPVQFDILSVFIMYLEQNPIHRDEFFSYLSSYYDSLSTAEKLQLRTHETRKKYINSSWNQSKKHTEKHLSHKPSQQQISQTQSTRIPHVNTNSKYSGNKYIKSIRNFT